MLMLSGFELYPRWVPLLFLGSHLDLSTHCYWLVKKAIVNFPIKLKLNFDTPLR